MSLSKTTYGHSHSSSVNCTKSSLEGSVAVIMSCCWAVMKHAEGWEFALTDLSYTGKDEDNKNRYLICPLTSGRFFVRFMLESKGTSKYCGDRATSGLTERHQFECESRKLCSRTAPTLHLEKVRRLGRQVKVYNEKMQTNKRCWDVLTFTEINLVISQTITAASVSLSTQHLERNSVRGAAAGRPALESERDLEVEGGGCWVGGGR